MSDYLTDVQLLESELGRVEQAFRGLTSGDWRRPTLLQPPGDTLPPWTIFELAGHLDIAVGGVTRMLISSQQDGQVSRDRVSFFIFPRSQVAPVFYDYAYTMVEGKSPGQMADVLAESFTRTIAEARATSPDVVGLFEYDGDEVLMRLGEFVASRMVEAVVHGLDLSDALGQDPVATPEGVAMTASIFDELLARRTVPGRPADLTDDMAWIRAASGRSPHADPRLPLLG
jgi:uncharacterized protein (TIGR03083 family)